jgi:hypothetical protein
VVISKIAKGVEKESKRSFVMLIKKGVKNELANTIDSALSFFFCKHASAGC